MRIAILSDIHGNLPALDAVLASIHQQDVDAIYCLGDLVGYAPFPNEVTDRIRGEGIPTIIAIHLEPNVRAQRPQECLVLWRHTRARPCQ